MSRKMHHHTLSAVNVLMSAQIPAPPPECIQECRAHVARCTPRASGMTFLSHILVPFFCFEAHLRCTCSPEQERGVVPCARYRLPHLLVIHPLASTSTHSLCNLLLFVCNPIRSNIPTKNNKKTTKTTKKTKKTKKTAHATHAADLPTRKKKIK